MHPSSQSKRPWSSQPWVRGRAERPLGTHGNPGCRRRRAVRPLVQSLEDRTLLSAFYNLTTLASTAGGVFTGFGDLPSINNQGVVAFVGNSDSGNGIWTADLGGQLTNVTAAFTANNDGRTYGRGVAINDSNQIVAHDQIGTGYYVREWDGNNPNNFTDLFKYPADAIDSPDSQFDSAQTFTAVNNEGDAAFVLVNSEGGNRNVVETSGANLGDGTFTSLAEYDFTGPQASPRPQLDDNGNVVYVSPEGQLIRAAPDGSQQVIASAANGNTNIGNNAGISADGRVIVFTSRAGFGPVLRAAFKDGSSWAIVSLAGDTLVGDSFSSFDTNSDIVVNSTWATDRSFTVAFKGTSALGTGIYSVQVSVFGEHPLRRQSGRSDPLFRGCRRLLRERGQAGCHRGRYALSWLDDYRCAAWPRDQQRRARADRFLGTDC